MATSKDTFYFSHDYNSRGDRKLVNLLMKCGVEGIGIYWCIVEMLYEENGYLLRSECERIAFELRTSCDKVAAVIETELFSKDDNQFWSDSVLRRLALRKNKSEKARESANSRWHSDKDANALQTQSEWNAIKERKGKEIKENSIKEKSKAEDFSEEIEPYERLKMLHDEKKTEEVTHNQQLLENMIVLEMMKIWMKHCPTYAEDKYNDYPVCLSIAYKIAERKKWKRAEVLNGRMQDTLKSWEKIAVFIRGHKFYKTKQLSTLEGQWASICLEMEEAKEGAIPRHPKIVL